VLGSTTFSMKSTYVFRPTRYFRILSQSSSFLYPPLSLGHSEPGVSPSTETAGCRRTARPCGASRAHAGFTSQVHTVYEQSRIRKTPARHSSCGNYTEHGRGRPLLEGVEDISNVLLTGNQTVIIYRSPRTGITRKNEEIL
jgi:hypothetical protein